MKQKFLHIAFVVSLIWISGLHGSLFAQAPLWIWAHDLGPYSGTMKAGNSGSVTSWGDYFVDTQIGDTVLKASGHLSINSYFAQYDKNGKFNWARRIGGALYGVSHINNRLLVSYVFIDSSQHSYVVGYYQDSVEFNDTVMFSDGFISIFIAKYDSYGNRMWVKTIATNVQPLYANAPDAYYYFVMTTQNDRLFLAGTIGDLYTSKPLILQIDTSGNVILKKILPFLGDCSNINIDSAGNLFFLCGVSTSDPSGGVFIRIMKMQYGDTNVVADWDLKPNPTYFRITATALDGNDNYYITGQFDGRFTIGDTTINSKGLPGERPGHTVLLKLNSQGKFLWIRQMGDSVDYPNDLVTDERDNIYLVGHCYKSIIGADSVQLGYLVKYDPNGNVKWVINAKQKNGSWGGISLSIYHNILYLIGGFDRKVSFGNSTLGDSNASRMFIAAMDLGKGLSVPYSQTLLQDLRVFPNPTTGIITVHNASANIQHVTVSSILGESVLELEHPNAPEFTLDLSKLPAGIYFARFVMAGEVVSRKIIRE